MKARGEHPEQDMTRAERDAFREARRAAQKAYRAANRERISVQSKAYDQTRRGSKR